MPYIDKSYQQQHISSYGTYEHSEHNRSSFDEVFAASIGLVIDEELSISAGLNREGWDARRSAVHELIKNNELEDIDKFYQSGRPGQARLLDYNKIAIDLNRDDIKTDEQLHEERNAMLKQRRKYAQDVIDRGSGTAQFLGALNAYMLDPINIVTLGIAAPVSAARATTTIGRAALMSRNAAIIEGATELGIQTFVYQHKDDIDSPYSSGDALANIGMAATGAGILGGVTGGVSGWLNQVLKKADELPQMADVKTAKEYLQRQQQILKSAPKIDAEKVKAQVLEPESTSLSTDATDIKTAILAEAREELLPIAGNRLSRGELKQLRAEKRELKHRLLKIQDPTKADIESEVRTLKARDKRLKARARKKQAEDTLNVQTEETRDTLRQRISIIDSRIAASEKASKSYADLSRIEQGVVPDRYQRRIDEIIHEQQVESDIKHLQKMDETRVNATQRSRSPEMYQKPETPRENPIATASQRERQILASQGLDKNFDADMAEFKAIENPILEVDGETVDVKALVAQYDDEISGLDDVLRCAYG